MSSQNLEEKSRAATVLRLIRQPGAKVTMRMTGREELAIPLGGEWVLDNEKADRYLKALEDYRAVTQTFGIPVDGVVQAEELVRVGQHLNLFACIASNREITAEFLFPKDDPPPGVVLGDHVSLMIAPVLGFAETNLLVLTAVSGKVEEEDDRFNRVRATRLPRLGHRLFTHITEEQIEEELRAGGRVLENLGVPKVFLRPFGTLPKRWLPHRAASARA